jgi:5'-AMP-activated protein kinase, catalytic alpha subunit
MQGLIIGVNSIPVNKKILTILEEKYNFRREFAKKCLIKNKHNHVTTSYYLLYQKYERLGMLSKEDELDLLSEEENDKPKVPL